MCARLLACPLCSQPGFLTLDALRAGLVSVATRPLICPVCNEVLLGIDKLTIHLFSHTINLNNNNAAESSKHIVSNEHPVAVHNAHNITLQDWNVSKTQQSSKTQISSGNNRTCAEPSDTGISLSNAGNKISIINSQVQNQDSPVKSASQYNLVADYNYDVIKVNIMPQSNKNQDVVLSSTTNLQQGVLKTNCELQSMLCNDSMKHLTVSQENTQVEKEIIADLITVTKVAETIDTNIFENIEEQCAESNNSQHIAKERLITSSIEKESDLSNFQSIQNVMPVCIDTSSEECNKKQLFNTKEITLKTNTENQDSKYTNALSNVQACNSKVFRNIAPKERTERCNICGFHFPDVNILALHKQLVHEQDSNNIPGKALKNYSCHLCSKVFKMRGSLMVHMRVAHIGHNTGKYIITIRI